MSNIKDTAFKELMRLYKNQQIWFYIIFIAWIITLACLLGLLIITKGKIISF